MLRSDCLHPGDGSNGISIVMDAGALSGATVATDGGRAGESTVDADALTRCVCNINVRTSTFVRPAYLRGEIDEGGSANGTFTQVLLEHCRISANLGRLTAKPSSLRKDLLKKLCLLCFADGQEKLFSPGESISNLLY